MTLTVIDAAAGGGNARSGGPKSAAPWMYLPHPWYPNSGIRDEGPDSYFVQNFKDGVDLFERGGQMSAIQASYWTDAKASLVTGPFVYPAIGEKTTATGGVVIPAVGLIDPTDFTIEFRVRPKGGVAGSTLTGNLLWIGSTQTNDGIGIYKTAGSSISARPYVAGSAGVNPGISGLVSGDLPADTWTAVSLTLRASTLTLRIGNNSKSGAGTMTTALPFWAFDDGDSVIAFLTSAAHSELSGAWEMSDLHIGPSRLPGTFEYVQTPTAAIDFDTSVGSVSLPDLGGLMGQYAYWAGGFILDGVRGGGGNAIRNAIFESIGADGCKFARIEHAMDKLSVTGTTPNFTLDTSVLGEQVAAMLAVGINRFHFSLTGTPDILAGGGNVESAVPSSFSDYAIIASKLVTWLKTLDIEYFCLLGWNEPEADAFWEGTAAQMASLWLAVQAKLATDHPDVDLGGADGGILPASGSADPTTNVILQASANGREMPYIGSHAGYLREYDQGADFRATRAYIAANTTYGANMPIRVGEWSPGYGIQQLWLGNGASVANDINLNRGHPTAGVAFTARCFRKMANYALDGNVLSAAFTRMGTFDVGASVTEQASGLFTHDNPPRPTAAYPAFQAVWKLAGQRKQATVVNAPWLKVLASETDDGVKTFAYGSLRMWDPKKVLRFSLDFVTALPDEFTWKMWRFDHRDADVGAADNRLVLIAEGTEANMPLGTDLTAQGVGCIQITPS